MNSYISIAHECSGSAARAGIARSAVTLMIFMTLAACASAPPSAGAAGTQPRAASAQVPQNGDSDQRSRKFQHAEALYLSGHLKEAAAAFEELTHAYPRDGRIWFRYGNTQAKLGAYDEAANAFQTALSVEPGQGPAALNLALVRLAQAQEALNTATAGLPAQSPEGQQAGALKSQLDALVGTPIRGSASAPH